MKVSGIKHIWVDKEIPRQIALCLNNVMSYQNHKLNNSRCQVMPININSTIYWHLSNLSFFTNIQLYAGIYAQEINNESFYDVPSESIPIPLNRLLNFAN